MTLDAADFVLIIGTLIFPPFGVYVITGCGPDLLVNIILTILGYFPGHIHAFYLIYVFYERRQQARSGVVLMPDAAGVFSPELQSGRAANFKDLSFSEVSGRKSD